jgi:hypothetical protein
MMLELEVAIDLGFDPVSSVKIPQKASASSPGQPLVSCIWELPSVHVDQQICFGNKSRHMYKHT